MSSLDISISCFDCNADMMPYLMYSQYDPQKPQAINCLNQYRFSASKAGDQKLLKRLDCEPSNFLMLGNSIKSDILPVLEIGGFAAHIPYHVTWTHEYLSH